MEHGNHRGMLQNPVGQVLDLIRGSRRASRNRAAEGAHDVAARERRRALRQPVRAEQLRRQDLDAEVMVVRPAAACGVGRPAELAGALAPICEQPRRVDVTLLCSPRRQRGRFGRPRPGRATLGQRRLDLGSATAERTQHPRRHPLHLCDAPLDRRPLKPKLAGELRSQQRLVEVARRRRVGVQPPPIERRPAAIGTPGQVRDHHVRVQLRIPPARRSVPERRRDEPVDLLDDSPVVAAPDGRRRSFEVPERVGDGGVVRRPHRLSHLAVAGPEQHAHAFGRRERHVERRHLQPRRRLS